MTRNKLTITLIPLFIIVIAFLSTSAVQAQAETATNEPVCQIYHLSVDQARIRSCAGEDCPIIGGASQYDALCIRGVSEDNASWMEIDLDPENDEDQNGYISRDIIVPGLPGTSPEAFAYCDAWQVIPEEVIVRSAPSSTTDIIGTLAAGDQICVEDYYYLYSGWSAFVQPATGQTGWVNTSNLRYVYDESLGCEESRQVIADAALHTCAGRGCETDTILTTGTRVCLTSEAEEEGLWVSFKRLDAGGRNGWVRLDLLQPIEEEVTAEAQAQTTAVAEATTEVAQVVTPTALPDLPPIAEGTAIVLCPVGASPVQPGACVTATPTPLPNVVLPGNGLLLARNVNLSTLLFNQATLFQGSMDLISPQDSAQYFFRLPEDWLMTDPITMYLNFTYSENLSTFTTVEGARLVSQFDIRLNNELVATVNLGPEDVGQQVLEVPLPARLLNNPGRTSHLLEMVLSARDYCRVNAETRISINGESSYVGFIYEEEVPLINLAYYPRPFYNSPVSGDLKTAWMVVPDSPSDAELSTIARIAGGLGYLTGNGLDLKIIGASALTPEIWTAHNIIVVGRPDTNPLLADLYQRNLLPSTLEGQQIVLEGTTISETDGIIQMIAHPDNPLRAVLAATSMSDEGLLKAGQALAGPPSLLNLSGNAFVVVDTQAIARVASSASSGLPPATYTLADLGVREDVVLTGIGSQEFSFDFRLPLGGKLRDDAYIELLYNASSIITDSSASLNLLVNDLPIAGVALNDDTVQTSDAQQIGFRSVRAQIPASAASSGANEIRILVDMRGDWGCELPDFEAVWTTISRNSIVYLPQDPVPFADLFPTVAQFPVPFNALPNLENLWIQMPEVMTNTDLTQLIELMGYLGSSNPLAEGIRPVVNRGELPEGANLADYNFIVIGRPSTNSFLRELNSNLPQPFAEGSDDLEQIYDDVSYRLLPGLNVGVLQILRSPWSTEHNILVMSGTSEGGQINAGKALLDLEFGAVALFGDIVFATDTDATAVDTRYVYTPLEILQAIPELGGVAQSVPQPATATTTSAEVAVMVVTATPDPSLTPAVQQTQPTLSATLIFTPTPQDSFQGTVEAVQPLSAETIQNTQVERPQWVTILIGISVVLVALALIYNMVATIWRRGKDE